MIKNNTENQYKEYIEKIANILGLGVPRISGDSLQMCCPFHIEGNPSFGINVKNGTYHCFACDAKGHISKIVDNLRSNIIAEKADKIEDFEVSVKVDTVSYSAKPSGREVGAIRNRLVGLSISKYTIDDLLELITTGHTVSLSGAKTNDEWAGQQICMVDIDNDYQTTFDDILRYAKSINLEPTFAYHTYSSTENCCRCRLAYVFKEPITDKQLYQAIVNSLIMKFAEYSADKACADLCRLFYGTVNKDVFVSNIIYFTRFTSEQLNSIWKSKSRSKARDRVNLKADGDAPCDTTEFFVEGKFMHHIFGQYMIDKYHIIRLNNNLLHLYKEGIYENNSETHSIEDEITNHIPSLYNKQIDEIMGYISRKSKKEVESDFRFIAFKNGILNILTMNFMEFTPDIILKSKVNTEYVPYDSSVSNQLVDKFFADITCQNKELEILLFEIIGYSCCRTNMYHLSFILKGNGGNGKSTYFKIIKELLGDSSTSIRLKKVTTDKFAATSLYGKTVAIADDINNGRDVDTGLLKTIISGDAIRTEFKFENEFEFEPVATILIGMNNIVTFNDTSDGFSRRFKVVPFNYKFVEGKNRNNNMKKMLCTPENLQYICSKAMYYFSKVIERDKFTNPQEVSDETRSYLLENNIVEQFVQDVPISREETIEVYAEFKSWCKQNDYNPYSSNKLGQELKRLGYTKERGTTGKRPYYYVAPNYNGDDDITIRIEQVNKMLNNSENDFDFSDIVPDDLNFEIPE